LSDEDIKALAIRFNELFIDYNIPENYENIHNRKCNFDIWKLYEIMSPLDIEIFDKKKYVKERKNKRKELKSI